MMKQRHHVAMRAVWAVVAVALVAVAAPARAAGSVNVAMRALWPSAPESPLMEARCVAAMLMV